MSKKISISEAARILKLSRQGLYLWIHKGILTPRRSVGGKPYFLEEDLNGISRD